MTVTPPEPWDDAKIRETFIYDGGEADYHNPISGASEQRRFAGGIFDAWLERHDAEKRAEWEAEQGTKEPEWDYGYTSKWGVIAAASREDAESRAANYAHGITEARESGDLKYHGKVVKRIAPPKAGPWMPVEQGKTTKTEGNDHA